MSYYGWGMCVAWNVLLRLVDVRCLECAATFGGCALPGMCCYVWWMRVAWNVLLLIVVRNVMRRLVAASCLDCAAMFG